MAAELTRVRARIASLKAADQTFASAAAASPAPRSKGDLSRMTIREAILTVLAEVKPEPSVDLTTLKQADEVLNPRWDFWTVP
jgi:hypothetical protein